MCLLVRTKVSRERVLKSKDNQTLLLGIVDQSVLDILDDIANQLLENLKQTLLLNLEQIRNLGRIIYKINLTMSVTLLYC